MSERGSNMDAGLSTQSHVMFHRGLCKIMHAFPPDRLGPIRVSPP